MTPTSAPRIACTVRNPDSSSIVDHDQEYTVEDHTNELGNCEVSDIDDIWHPPDTQLIAQPNANRVLDFWWIDGICGDRVLRLSKKGHDYALAIGEVSDPMPNGQTIGPCPAEASVAASGWS